MFCYTSIHLTQLALRQQYLFTIQLSFTSATQACFTTAWLKSQEWTLTEEIAGGAEVDNDW